MTDAQAPVELHPEHQDLPEIVDQPEFFWSRGRILGLAGALGTLLWMMWPAFSAKFGIIDDHEIVDIIGHHSHLPLSQVPHEIISRTNESQGRFRPLYWVFRVLEGTVGGHNGTVWYVDRFLLAAVTVTAIYLTAARFMPAPAALLVSLVPFAGPQWETFIRLGPNEAYAFPLAVAGIAVLVWRLRTAGPPATMWPGYLLLVASAYTKENFVALVLMAVPITALAHGRDHLVRKDFVVMGATLVAAAIDAVVIVIVVDRYGAVYPQKHTFGSVRAWANYAFGAMENFQAGAVGVVAAVILLAAWSTTPRRQRLSMRLVGLVLLVGLPQLWFYSGNAPVGRYLYPFMLVTTMIWGVALWRAAELPLTITRRVTSGVLLVALAWPLHNSLHQSRMGAVQVATSTRTFQRNLANLITVAHDQQDTLVVLQPIDPINDGERMLSLARYLTYTTDLPVMLLPATKPGKELDAQIAVLIAGWSKNGYDGILPYSPPTTRCLSVVFGVTKPVCRDAITPPG